MSENRERINRFFDAADKLHTFQTSAAVAEFLTGLGYKGQRQSSTSCPVSRFVRDCVGDPDARIDAGGFDIRYQWKNERNKVDFVTVSTTSTPVSDFIRLFDGDEYPDMIENDAEMATA